MNKPFPDILPARGCRLTIQRQPLRNVVAGEERMNIPDGVESFCYWWRISSRENSSQIDTVLSQKADITYRLNSFSLRKNKSITLF